MSSQHLPRIDQRWTIFLDRDGVLNRHRPDDYVKNWSEWEWLSGAADAVATFGSVFRRVIVVTNQQGVGRGLMTVDDLRDVHCRMLADIAEAGGRVDAIYFAPELKTDPSNRRKPKPAMAEEAARDFTDIDLSRTLMVGDSDSDMAFGRAAGAYTVRIHPRPEQAVEHQDVDYSVRSLAELAALLKD